MTSSLLHLRLEDNSGTINFHKEIPSQVITLKQYSITYASHDAAISQSSVFVKLPFFGNNQTISSVSGLTNSLCLLSNPNTTSLSYETSGDTEHMDQVISYCEPNIKISLQKNIDRQIQYAIYDSAGALINQSNIIRVDLVFEIQNVPIIGIL